MIFESSDKKLLKAVKKRNIKKVKTLLEKDADINAKDEDGYSPLMISIYNEEMLRVLLANDPDINAQNNEGKTALMLALKWNDAASVQLLLDQEPDILIRDKSGNNALDYAFDNKDRKLMKKFLKKGCRIVNGEDFFMINWAIGLDDKKLAKMLVFGGLNLEVGTDGVAEIKIKQTLLCRAAKWGDVDLIDFLITKGAEVNQTDNAGFTPLVYAAKNGHLDAATELLGKGAWADADVNHGTAMKHATKNGHKAIVALLLEHGAKDTRWRRQ